ncbi:MAG TPA: hypothetical protein PK514_07490 [Spirochaetota bacterium]|nr:hypothetical protein [Spirochaetota bacterium]
MKTDNIIKREGFEALFAKLDLVEAERFIALIKRENFDYTEWRKNLWENMTVEELSAKAMSHYRNKKK